MLEPEEYDPDDLTISSAANIPEFENAYGEAFNQTLNLDTWIMGEDLAEMYGRLEQEIADAVAMEDSYRQTIRNEVFSKIKRALP